MELTTWTHLKPEMSGSVKITTAGEAIALSAKRFGRSASAVALTAGEAGIIGRALLLASENSRAIK